VNFPILPGSTLGILGSGQLGRMLAIAAKQLGYRVAIYSPDTDTPAGQVADVEAVGDYLDEERLADFAQRVSVITFEFENVPSRASEVAAQHTIVRPAGSVLHITQERLREKNFLRDNGFPTTPFREVKTYADLHAAARDLGLPAVLKTASFGYDGKGQQKVYAQSDPEKVFAALGGAVGIYEAWVDFEKEISVVAARTAD
jgi:5-(carboxyamino)imidazole ribonucleotide synthase